MSFPHSPSATENGDSSPLSQSSCSDGTSSSNSRSGGSSTIDFSSSDEDELEVTAPNVQAQCLFCPETKERVPLLQKHMQNDHKFDMEAFRQKFEMDQYSYVKMVNYCRSQSCSLQSTEDLLKESTEDLLKEMRNLLNANVGKQNVPWRDDEWLVPVLENDVLLHYWIGIKDDENEKAPEAAAVEDVQTKDEYEQGLRDKLVNYPELQEDLERLLISQKTMREIVNRFVKEPQDEDSGAGGGGGSRQNQGKGTCASSSENEVEYFESYDGVEIHADMLKDLPRTLAYQRVIQKNGEDFAGKTVLDLGCGTGILSMFSVDAGASLVYAVDVSKIIYEAMEICFDNNKEKNIKFINKKLELITPDEVDKVDILISEFMGYFLLFEGMTSSYLYARDHFLKPGGKMFPSAADMLVVAISDEEKYHSEVGIWDCMHGYKMSTLKRKVLKEAVVAHVEAASLASLPFVIQSWNLHTCQPSNLQVERHFKLKITRDCSLTAICGYFSVGFDDGSVYQETLDTSPVHPPTHWKQTVFYLPEKIPVVSGESLPIYFSCKPHPEFDRWLSISLKIKNVSHTYEMK